MTPADQRRDPKPTARSGRPGASPDELEPLLTGMDDAADGCLLTDAAGEVTYANQSLLKQTGLERRRVVGRAVRSLVADRSAAYDPATGLASDGLLAERASAALALARRYERSVAVGRLELEADDAPGDVVLQAVATELLSSLRETDLVARLSDGSFAVVLQEVEPDESLGRVAQRVLGRVRRATTIAEVDGAITARMGMALFPRDASGWEELMDRAAAALAHAVRADADFAFHEPSFTARTQDRLQLEQDFAVASDSSELMLHYQPVVATVSGEVVGAEALARGQVMGIEALARWPHHSRGLVAPSEFIPIAESTGRILSLDRWAAATAVRQASAWWARGWQGWVSVNLSTRSVRDPELVDFIAGLLKNHDVDPARLMLEVTETTAMRDPDTTASILRELKALGVRIAIDDFGTGHSSLAYLRKLPVDLIKLDRSFIQDLGTDERDRSLVESIVALAHRLGAQIVAEGVEQSDDLEWLRAAGCDLVQGYLTGRPGPAEELDAGLVAAGRRAPT